MKTGVRDGGFAKIDIAHLAAMKFTTPKIAVSKIDISIDTANRKGAEIENGVAAVLRVREAVERYPVEKGIAEKTGWKTVFRRLVVELLADDFSSVSRFIAVLTVAGFGILLG